MCASSVWFQEQRLRDLSSESCIFALSDAQCSCALLLHVCKALSRAAGGIPELWQQYPVALLLRRHMLCTVTVASSHPRNVWECCSRSRSHRADALPAHGSASHCSVVTFQSGNLASSQVPASSWPLFSFMKAGRGRKANCVLKVLLFHSVTFQRTELLLHVYYIRTVVLS